MFSSSGQMHSGWQYAAGLRLTQSRRPRAWTMGSWRTGRTAGIPAAGTLTAGDVHSRLYRSRAKIGVKSNEVDQSCLPRGVEKTRNGRAKIGIFEDETGNGTRMNGACLAAFRRTGIAQALDLPPPRSVCRPEKVAIGQSPFFALLNSGYIKR